MEILKVLNNEERELLLSKRGFKTRKVEFTCSRCNKTSITLLKKLSEDFLCRKCKISLTKSNITEEEKKNINEKRKQTTLKSYGVENVSQVKEFMEKARGTLEEKYGVSNARALQLDENYTPLKERKVEKEVLTEEEISSHFSEVEEYKTKWGEWTEEDVLNILEKRKQTCKEKYGVPFASQSEEVKEKTKQNNLKKYGVEYPMQCEEVKEKVETTFLKKYGSRHPNFAYKYKNQCFDSSWELAVYLWAESLGKQIEREPIKLEYEFEGKKHFYIPNFRIEGKLVEVKGPQFFEGDKMIDPWNRANDGKLEAKHQCGLKNGVEFWSTKEMLPILKYIEGKYTEDFIPLFQVDLPFPFPPLKSGDFNTIRHFHKSLYLANRKGKLSPFEAWGEKDLILKSALNRLKYRGSCKPSDVLQGFNVAKIAPKVSVFKPTLAEELIEKYLSNFNEIFDPFSGFSGRMIAAARKGKKYVGQDINSLHVEESNEIIKYLELKECNVKVQDILTDVPQTHECLFTCPPYGGKEHWGMDEVEKSCDEWIDLCLQKYKCNLYLFVVDETEKYKDKIVEVVKNKSHFGCNEEYVVLLD